jgi:trimethylamine--corrinoid protein Co-methyltransferase
MDSEIFSWNAAIAAGIDVQDETIALDAIKQVGIGGNYLGQRHTRRHMKDVWRPRLLDRTMWDAWSASGREGAYEKATTIAAELLAGHTAVPLGAEARGVIARIIAGPGL